METKESIEKEIRTTKRMINNFEKNCRLTKSDRCNRMVKAWRVPGTREHGTRSMYLSILHKEEKKLADLSK